MSDNFSTKTAQLWKILFFHGAKWENHVKLIHAIPPHSNGQFCPCLPQLWVNREPSEGEVIWENITSHGYHFDLDCCNSSCLMFTHLSKQFFKSIKIWQLLYHKMLHKFTNIVIFRYYWFEQFAIVSWKYLLNAMLTNIKLIKLCLCRRADHQLPPTIGLVAINLPTKACYKMSFRLCLDQ